MCSQTKEVRVLLSHSHAHASQTENYMTGRALNPVWFEIDNNSSSEFYLALLTQGHLTESCLLVTGVHCSPGSRFLADMATRMSESPFGPLLDISIRKPHEHFQINLSKFKVILFLAAKLLLFLKCPCHS